MRLLPLAHFAHLAAAIAVVLVTAACGAKVDSQTSGGAAGGEGGQAGQGGHDPTTSSGGVGGSGPVACGGFAGVACPAHQFCHFEDGLCGGDDSSGVCEPIPLDCDSGPPGPEVCGCDNQIYPSACAANIVGVDVTSRACAPPPGSFACGPTITCNIESEYCERDISDVGGEPDGFGCHPLPSGCSTTAPDCDCLANEPCGFSCSTDGSTFVLSCPGG